ncbi:helix-turn-helix domain-containing protein [Cohnella sp.]|uniref:helix-turn-helix domain-containing protein n=1 Tax=Cohnella sp. TaxID=1883426 RepID=UPI003565C2E8
MLDYSAIGRNLGELRNKSGKTQMELAKLLNVSHQAVSKWERGQALPGIESFLILSDGVCQRMVEHTLFLQHCRGYKKTNRKIGS